MASTTTTTRSPSVPSSTAATAILPSAKPAQTEVSAVQSIGLTAGDIWRLLDAEGPQPISKLIKQIDAQRDTILQALGWLAREDKIRIEDDGRSRMVSLRSS